MATASAFVRTPVVRLEPGCLFADGLTDVAVGLVFESIGYPGACGCAAMFGLRLDNGEKAMLSYPCDRHRERWHLVIDGLTSDEEGVLTEVLLGRLIANIDANEGRSPQEEPAHVSGSELPDPAPVSLSVQEGQGET